MYISVLAKILGVFSVRNYFLEELYWFAKIFFLANNTLFGADMLIRFDINIDFFSGI